MTRIEVSDNPQTRERHPAQVPQDAVLHWRIYYRDGRTVSSKEMTWAEAPSDKIVAVVHALNDEPAACELGTPYYWHHGDWIARAWDVTLYLRQTGKVKFGRWASYGLFHSAWEQALKYIALPSTDPTILGERSMQSGVVFTTETVNDSEAGVTWRLYYDNGAFVSNENCPWDQAPSDGVLAATYSCVYSGLKLKAAMRRYTYYYWRLHELVNTDDLDDVLDHFSQCKRGEPSFSGKSYRHQAEALSQAMKDQLEDIR